MMNRAVGTILLVSLALCSTVRAGETAQEVLEKVKRKYDSIKDAELKFSQRIKFEMSQQEMNANGTLFIKKENKFRLEVESRIVVTDGNTVWSYAPATKQVLIDHFKLDENAITPERILAAAPEDYYASVVGSEKIGKSQTQQLKLVPKDDNSLVRTMKLWIDDATWLMKKVEIVDVNGKQTVYTINDVKVNIGIPDARFTFQIPDGAESVDLR